MKETREVTIRFDRREVAGRHFSGLLGTKTPQLENRGRRGSRNSQFRQPFSGCGGKGLKVMEWHKNMGAMERPFRTWIIQGAYMLIGRMSRGKELGIPGREGSTGDSLERHERERNTLEIQRQWTG